MKQRLLPFTLAVFAIWATAALASAGQDASLGTKFSASAFELRMRILEGNREKSEAAGRPVTSSFLRFLTFSNFDTEEDRATEQQIMKIFSIKDLDLLTEAPLVWIRGSAERAFHMFRINGQEYLVIVTPGRLPERNHFHIEVYEQGASGQTSLLDTEFSLPEKTAAVFGFEDTKLKSYFITLRVARWLGEPVAWVGADPGVAGEALKAGGERGVKPPRLIKQVDPVYPPEARKARVEGVVILEATTDTYGRVAGIKVLRGIPPLGQAAMDALKQWVYEPMVIDGKPRPVTFTVTVQFRLDKEKGPEVSGSVGGVEGGVEGGVSGGVAGGVKGGVEGGVAKTVGALDIQAEKQFEGDAVRAVGETKPPKLIKEVDPVYPEIARQVWVEGVVILEAKTDEYGNVVDVRVLRSIPLLDQAAIDAVRKWKYEPLVVDGKPRKVLFTVAVRFALDNGSRKGLLKKFAGDAVRAEGDIKPPRLLKSVDPVYPEIARQAKVAGVVILGVKINEEGRVLDAIVLRSIPLLDQAAIDAVKQWVYEPYVKDGKPTPMVFTVTVRFVPK